MGGVSGQACVLRPGGVCSRDSAPGNGVSCFPLRKDCTCCSMLKDVRDSGTIILETEGPERALERALERGRVGSAWTGLTQ